MLFNQTRRTHSAVTSDPMKQSVGEITAAVAFYRECVRSLWNVYFLTARAEITFDLVDDFEAIRRDLFRCLVLERFDDEIPEDGVLVRAAPTYDGAVILVKRPSSDGNNYWDEPAPRIREDAEFEYLDLFDFGPSAPREFRYVKVRVRQLPDRPDLSGREALMAFEDAKFFA